MNNTNMNPSNWANTEGQKNKRANIIIGIVIGVGVLGLLIFFLMTAPRQLPLRVEIWNLFSRNVAITYIGDAQITLQRLVVNSRDGTPGCDLQGNALLKPGDQRTFYFTNAPCGSDIEWIDIYTDQGRARASR